MLESSATMKIWKKEILTTEIVRIIKVKKDSTVAIILVREWVSAPNAPCSTTAIPFVAFIVAIGHKFVSLNKSYIIASSLKFQKKKVIAWYLLCLSHLLVSELVSLLNLVGIYEATSLDRSRRDSFQRSGSNGILDDQMEMSPLPTWCERPFLKEFG